jgi:nitrate/nitrite transporter NarK
MIDAPAIRIGLIAIAFACTLAFTAPFWAIPASFLTGGASAGGIGVISALGVTGGFLSPWFIGYMRDTTGDFRGGLGTVAIIAIVFATALYLFGRRDAAAGRA